MYTLFTLIDPRDGRTRVIGSTTQHLRKRVADMMAAAVRGFDTSKKGAWLNELAELKLFPVVKPHVELADTEAAMNETLKLYDVLRAAGEPILTMPGRNLGMLGRPHKAQFEQPAEFERGALHKYSVAKGKLVHHHPELALKRYVWSLLQTNRAKLQVEELAYTAEELYEYLILSAPEGEQ
jgi:hypothetical protein